MMRGLGASVLVLMVAACSAPPVPDSGAGVGLNSTQAQQQRDAALSQSTLSPPPPVTAQPLDARRTQPTGQSTATNNTGTTPPTRVQANPLNPPPPIQNAGGISDENDFKAVSRRQSIESDAARIARNRAQYQVIQPKAVPTRTGATGPNIVSFALQTTHPRGTKLYRRIGLTTQARHQRNCAKYASSDLAQTDFLARGGPERDPRGLDPDGDGYACTWDPARFRAAVRS